MKRRIGFIALLTICTSQLAFLNSSFGQTGIVPDGTIPIQLETLIQWSPQMNSNSSSLELTPTKTINLNDGTGRILISTLGGTIRVMRPLGAGYELLSAPLLNTNQVGQELQQESGMTALAVHPDFAANPSAFGYGKLYTITVEDSASNGGLSNGNVDFSLNNEVHQDVLREWDISAIVGNANANSLSGFTVANSRELMRVDQPGFCHNLVDIAFDPSAQPGDENYGLLFVTVGDGCGVDIGTSQNLGTILGNVLRIDPDPNAHPLVRITENSTAPNAGQPTYSIPSSNPFNGDNSPETRQSSTLAEIFAYGLRSPYRLGFDSLNGDMFIGDVGQNSREEVTKIESATNGGWGRYEGTRMNSGTPLQGPSPHTPPIFEYTTAVGRTVVGGLVYRGTAIPELHGKYVFADFGNFLPNGRLFYGSVDPSDPDFGEIFALVLDPDGSLFPIDTTGDSTPDTDSLLPDRIFAITEDENNEILLVAGQDPRSFLPSVPGAYIIRVGESDLVIDEPPGDGPLNNPVVHQITLDYNFNGIVHLNEPSVPSANPDDPNGFRSISDRALDFRGGIPSNPTLDNYQLVGLGGELDIVHLGNRDTVSGGNNSFDNSPDGDSRGVRPNWLPNVDQTDRQTTVLAEPISLTGLADVSVIFQISNGGGAFDIVVGFSDASEISFTAAGPDWFGPFDGQPNIGSFPGTNSIDLGNPGEDLLITESIFRFDEAGKTITSIAFENATNFGGGVAIFGANFVVETRCMPGDVNQDGIVNLLDVAPFVDALSNSEFQCEADANEDGIVNLLDVAPFIELLSGD